MCRHCECDCGCGCGGNNCSCDCHGHAAHFERRYQTKAEQISELEAYLSDLKTEVQAVEEQLVDLKK
jgi:hypothetical protein